MTSVYGSTLGLYPVTASETTLAIVPSDLKYPEAHFKRYGAVGDGVTNDQTACQNAINVGWLSGSKVIVPKGTYKVTGLTLSQTSATQGRILWMEGVGAGNPFAAIQSGGGSIFVRTTDGPVFTADVDVPTSGATIRLVNLTFDGTSTATPAVWLKSFYGISEVSNCCVFQRSTGNGMQVDWWATSEIHNCYFLNKDWATLGLGAARVGIGLYYSSVFDAGLQTIRKCTSRGFLTGYKLGTGGAGTYMYSGLISDCETSNVYNGIHLTNNCRATTVQNCYSEGGDGGVGIYDQGDYNKIVNNFSFAGFLTQLKSIDLTYGNVYTGNTFAAASTANSVLIDITSDSVNGGPGKVCSGNHLSFGGSGGSIAGVIGIRINGTDPRIDLSGNSFNPRGNWVGGAGTVKISNLSVNGIYGLTTVSSMGKAIEIPTLSRGAISLALDDTTLTESNVSGNVLTITGGASYYDITCGVLTTINKIVCDNPNGRIITFNCPNTNTTFSNSANLQMSAAASFNSRGHITFLVRTAGSSSVLYELYRSTY